MPDVEKVIHDLEQCLDDSIAAVVPADTVCDAIALLKAQEQMVMAGAELTDAELIEEIQKAPIVLKPNEDAAPVVHGRWIKVPGFVTPGGDPVWRCSECGKGQHVYGIEHGSYGADVSDGQWVSCPNCGARMDGEPNG